MTDEMNVEIKEEKCNCFCHSKGFRKFLITATGTFVGVFCALSLFAALHKPPMMMPCPCHRMMMPPMAYPCPQFNKGMHKPMDFHKNFIKNKTRQEIPVRVEVDND